MLCTWDSPYIHTCIHRLSGRVECSDPCVYCTVGCLFGGSCTCPVSCAGYGAVFVASCCSPIIVRAEGCGTVEVCKVVYRTSDHRREVLLDHRRRSFKSALRCDCHTLTLLLYGKV